MSNLRVGIIGAGGHAQSHFRMIQDEPEMELVAVADLDPERLAHTRETHSVTSLFTDYREMIEKVQLDVVYVVTFPGPLPDIVIGLSGGRTAHFGREAPGHQFGSDPTDDGGRTAIQCQGDCLGEPAVHSRSAGDSGHAARSRRTRSCGGDVQQAAYWG